MSPRVIRAEERLLRLTAWLLTQREPVSVEQIQTALPNLYTGNAAAIDRKWSRDKQALQAAGVPITFVEGDDEQPRGYVVDRRHYYLPELKLTAEEAAVLWTAGQAAARMQGNPWREELEGALRKLQAGVTAQLPPQVPSLNLYYADALAPRRRARFLEALGEAVRRRKRVKLKYFTAARREVTEREVDVYGFAWRRGVWLFVGHCHLRKELRVFYVNRVRALKLNPKKPSEPDYAIPRSFDIREFARQQPWDFWSEPPRQARVRFGGSLAALAPQLLPGCATERTSDGQTLATLTVRNLDALVRQVLSFGPDAELLEPQAGRQRAREILEKLHAELASDSVVSADLQSPLSSAERGARGSWAGRSGESAEPRANADTTPRRLARGAR